MASFPAKNHTSRGRWMARATEAERLAADHREGMHEDHQTASCPECVEREQRFYANRGTGD